MFEPIDLASWREFFFTIAGASAALIGLIVVGLSIHADSLGTAAAARRNVRKPWNHPPLDVPSAAKRGEDALAPTSFVDGRERSA